MAAELYSAVPSATAAVAYAPYGAAIAGPIAVATLFVVVGAVTSGLAQSQEDKFQNTHPEPESRGITHTYQGHGSVESSVTYRWPDGTYHDQPSYTVVDPAADYDSDQETEAAFGPQETYEHFSRGGITSPSEEEVLAWERSRVASPPTPTSTPGSAPAGEPSTGPANDPYDDYVSDGGAFVLVQADALMPNKKNKAAKKAGKKATRVLAEAKKVEKKIERVEKSVVPRAPRLQVSLSRCAREYINLIKDVFNPHPNACYPCDMDPQPNAYYCVFTKGNGTTSTTTSTPLGSGFVSFSPFRMATSDTTCSYVTTSAFAGDKFVNSGTGVVDTYKSNSPFTAAASGTTDATAVKWRCIAAGLRVRYVGTQIAMGARVYGYVSRDHVEIHNQVTQAILLLDPRVHSRNLGRSWVELVLAPVESDETQFQLYNSSTPNWGATCAGFWIVAPDATEAAPFEYEAYAHFEAVGKPIQNYRDVDVDTTGGPAVKKALWNSTSKGTMGQIHQNFDKAVAAVVAGSSFVVASGG